MEQLKDISEAVKAWERMKTLVAEHEHEHADDRPATFEGPSERDTRYISLIRNLNEIKFKLRLKLCRTSFRLFAVFRKNMIRRGVEGDRARRDV